MKRIYTGLATLLALMLLLSAAITRAEAPPTISYQGRITDAIGDPVPDGNYTCNFRLYNSAVGGTLIWEEPGQIVTTVDGLFSTTLGSTAPFPQNFGDISLGTFGGQDTLWLEIEVAGEIQAPRTRLNSTPYAMAARDLSGWSTDFPGVGVETNSQFSSIATYGFGGDERARIWGPAFGELFLYGGTGSLDAVLSTSGSLGPYLELFDPGNSNRIFLTADNLGDSSVVLPDNAVNATEILNEPGIAFAEAGSDLTLTRSEASQDFVAVTITIPSPGYIVVVGHVYTNMIGGSTSAYIWSQISENSDAARIAGLNHFHGMYAGTEGFGFNSSTTNRRVFFMASAGTHTFYLQGNAWISNDPSVSATVYGTTNLQATFYPSSYGTVTTTIASPGDHPEATPLQVEDPMTGETSTAFSMDLRYYELKVKEAEKELLKARLEQERAERQAMIQSGQQQPVSSQE